MGLTGAVQVSESVIGHDSGSAACAGDSAVVVGGQLLRDQTAVRLAVTVRRCRHRRALACAIVRVVLARRQYPVPAKVVKIHLKSLLQKHI